MYVGCPFGGLTRPTTVRTRNLRHLQPISYSPSIAVSSDAARGKTAAGKQLQYPHGPSLDL